MDLRCFSRTFDQVRHNGLIYKLDEVAGDLLDTLITFIKKRKQRVILNGQHSTWKNVEAGVPQGSTLGPLLFLIYINGSPENLVSNPKLFADVTSLFSVIYNQQLSAQTLNEDINKINHWAFQLKMSFNPEPPVKKPMKLSFHVSFKNRFILHYILIAFL